MKREELIEKFFELYPETRKFNRYWIESAIDTVMGKGTSYRAWRRGVRKWSYSITGKDFNQVRRMKNILINLGFKLFGSCFWKRGFYICRFIHPSLETFLGRLSSAKQPKRERKTRRQEVILMRELLREIRDLKKDLRRLKHLREKREIVTAVSTSDEKLMQELNELTKVLLL